MMNDMSKYEPTLPYPNKKNHMSYEVVNTETMTKYSYETREDFEKAIAHLNVTRAEFSVTLNKALEDGKGSLAVGSLILLMNYDEKAYKAEQAAYREETSRLHRQFQNDLAVDNDIEPDSKLHSVIYSKAYEDGHSSGYGEVASKYSTLAEFADEIIEASKA